MFENRINSKANYILISFLVTGAFIVGRKSVPVLPAEIRIEKITDTHAIEKAVAEERKKINSKFSQKKIRDTTKLPDGTIKVHEQIANTRISEEMAEISKKYDLDVKSNEVEKTTVKSLQNNYSVELLIGKEKFNFFTSLPQESLIFGANLSYRIFGSTWIGAWGLWAENQIYGASVRQEF